MTKRVLFASALAAVLSGGAARVAAQAAPAKLTVTSPVIKDGQTIPTDYTGSTGAKNISPALMWSGAPASTKQFALILDDPDANFGGMPFVHWVVYKIPGTATGLPEALPAGAVTSGPLSGTIQGFSGFFSGRGRAGAPPAVPVYRGPAPPAGIPHHYHFTVYALDAALDLQEGLNKVQLLDAMKGHIVAQGELVGIFENK